MSMNRTRRERMKLAGYMIVIGILMSAGMTFYEYLKQMVFPAITIWESHVITILFSTFCALAATYFILRRQIGLAERLERKNIEKEHLQRELEDTVDQLRDTLSEIKTLSGLLPICASCKKIRDDKGYWYQLEAYIRDHSNVDFSHSICPECAEKLYPEFYRSIIAAGR